MIINGDMPVNDGGGLYDNVGLCDTLIVDLNNLPKLLFDGQYILFCAKIASMGQRLANLKKGIAEDKKSMEEKVDEFKRMNDRLVEQMTGLPVKKDGAE